MLASLGCLVQEVVHLPFPATSNPVASEAFFQVPAGGLWQIFAAIGAVEHFSNNFAVSPPPASSHLHLDEKPASQR
jgi:hypothetical protein